MKNINSPWTEIELLAYWTGALTTEPPKEVAGRLAGKSSSEN